MGRQDMELKNIHHFLPLSGKMPIFADEEWSILT